MERESFRSRGHQSNTPEIDRRIEANMDDQSIYMEVVESQKREAELHKELEKEHHIQNFGLSLLLARRKEENRQLEREKVGVRNAVNVGTVEGDFIMEG